MSSKMGRPKININKDEFEKLCGIQCTISEIAAWFSCSHDTIERFCKKTYSMTFECIFEQKRGKGLVSLRRTQFSEALKGNTTLLIWLGKQYLGQSDVSRQDLKLEGKVTLESLISQSFEKK